jgi:hypothetical protein
MIYNSRCTCYLTLENCQLIWKKRLPTVRRINEACIVKHLCGYIVTRYHGKHTSPLPVQYAAPREKKKGISDPISPDHS